MATKSKTKNKQRTYKKNNTSKVPKWLAPILIVVIGMVGIFLVYSSLAATKPNLRFQIMKGSACVNSVESNDSTVHIRISRTQGNEAIGSIQVKVDGQVVSTNPNSISEPTTNLLVASPTLSANPTTHNISVTGVKSGLGVTFSPYCETSGSSNNTVSVVSPDGTGTTTPVGQRLTDYLTPAELSAGSASSGNAEAGTPGGNIYGARNSTIYCNQGRCSIGYNYGNAVQTMIKPNWGCTNGSGWSYKVVSGTKKDRWLCTQDYSVENDPVVRPWLRVVACESGGNWAINTGNGFYGGLQFDLQTWQSVGGQGYPHQNSAHEQAYRASLLRSQRGTQPWPICGKYYNG